MSKACIQNGTSLEYLKVLPIGKRSLGIPIRRCEENIRIGINMISWIDLVQDGDYWKTIVNAALNFRCISRIPISQMRDHPLL